MTSFPELRVRHAERKSDIGWTEKQAVDSVLTENPLTVLMYCLHAMRVNIREVFPPTVLATVVHVDKVSAEGMGGAIIDVGGVKAERGGVGDEQEEGEEDENVEDNAITIDQISDWFQVTLYSDF